MIIISPISSKLGQHPLTIESPLLGKQPGRFPVTDETLAVYTLALTMLSFVLLVAKLCWGVLYYTEWAHVPCEFQGHCAL